MDGENCNYEKGGIVDKWLTGDEECNAYSTEFECGGVYNKNHMDILGNRDHDCFWDCSKCKYQNNNT
ncbi:MAG: hypothetical protein K6G20_08975 [Ruminococcus sp.]|nr:hypothetical protein [Ruminococcus sp.]